VFASFLFVLLGDERRDRELLSPTRDGDAIKGNVALTDEPTLSSLRPFVYQGDGYFIEKERGMRSGNGNVERCIPGEAA